MALHTCLSPQAFSEFPAGFFSVFRFLVKFFVNKNCHNFRANNDTYMKIEPVSKFKRNTRQEKYDGIKKSKDDAVLAKFVIIIIIIPIFNHFGYIRRKDSGWMVQ